jgi:protein TonB
MVLSLTLHGLAIIVLLAAGAAGSSTSSETALLVELALVSTPSAEPASESEAAPTQERETAIELAPPEEPPPIDLSGLKPIELAPPEEPPPLHASELKPTEPTKPKPSQKSEPARPAAKTAKATPSHDLGSAGSAQQAAAGFLAAAPIVWEGKPRYRHPPTPAVYPPRAVDLGQQGEVLVRVRLDPNGAAVEIVIYRSSGFELLDRAALAAVRGWQFLPAVRDGRAVAAWVEIPVRFHLR